MVRVGKLAIAHRYLAPVALCAFVMAGYYKSPVVHSSFPVDLTVLFAAIVLVLSVAETIRRGTIPRSAVTVLGVFCVLGIAVLWMPSSQYAYDKTARLFTLTLLSAVGPIMLLRNPGDVERCIRSWAVVSGLITLAALALPQPIASYAGAPVSALGDDTIAIGRAGGVVLVVAVMSLAWGARWRLLALGTAGAALFAMVNAGSRGPLLSAGLAFVAAVVFARRHPRIGPAALASALIIGLLMIAWAKAPFYSRARVVAFFAGTYDNSVNTRLLLYRLAGHSIFTTPLGLGWGGFQRIGFRGYLYPHDLPLEVLAEAGAVVGSVFLLWLGYRVVLAHRLTTDGIGGTVFALVLFMLFNALVSGDLNDNRTLFFALGIAIAAGNQEWGVPVAQLDDLDLNSALRRRSS